MKFETRIKIQTDKINGLVYMLISYSINEIMNNNFKIYAPKLFYINKFIFTRECI